MQELPIRLSPGPLTPFRTLVILHWQQVLQRSRSRISHPKISIPNYCSTFNVQRSNVNPAIGLWPEAGNKKKDRGEGGSRTRDFIFDDRRDGKTGSAQHCVPQPKAMLAPCKGWAKNENPHTSSTSSMSSGWLLCEDRMLYTSKTVQRGDRRQRGCAALEPAVSPWTVPNTTFPTAALASTTRMKPLLQLADSQH